jgi:beta-fructofuranosidase
MQQPEQAKQPYLTKREDGRSVVQFRGHEFLTGSPVLPEGADRGTLVAVWMRSNIGGVQAVFGQASAGKGRRASLLTVRDAYGFNGEQNDAHIGQFSAGRWNISILTVSENGAVVLSHADSEKTQVLDGRIESIQQVGNDAFVIGAKTVNLQERLEGSIAEILVYDRVLTGTETRQLQRSLADKWNIVPGPLVQPEKSAAIGMADKTPIEPVTRVDLETARKVRRHVRRDPYRPVYHRINAEGVGMSPTTDPNFAIYWKGRYHLWHYFVESRDVISFEHISSIDLVHWREHEPNRNVKGRPSQPPYELDAQLSGNAILDRQGRVSISFAIGGKGLGLAFSDDPLLEKWRNHPDNPLVSQDKMKANGSWDGQVEFAHWDPFIWLEGDTCYMISGGFPNTKPVPYKPALFKSKNLNEWRYVGPFMSREMPGVAPEEDISCADFFKMGDQYVLLCISHKRGARYYVGEWKDEQFYPEAHERLCWSQPNDAQFFAPESLVTPDGRRVMWAWVRPTLPQELKEAAGWAGMLSLPREIWMGDDQRLRMKPIDELKQLRFNPVEINASRLAGEQILEGISGRALELEINLDPGDAEKVGVKVCRSPDGTELTSIYYDVERKKLVIDTTKSGLRYTRTEEAPFELEPGEPLNLRIFIDHSVVEVFANERQAMVRRIYPTRNDSNGIALFSEEGEAQLLESSAWEMFPSNAY